MSIDSITLEFAQTTLAAAQQNTLAAVRAQIVNLNANLVSSFGTAFSNWLLNYTSGEAVIDRATAPVPPMTYIVGYFNDPTTGPGSIGPYGDTVVQWAYPALGASAVCPMPAIPDQVAPQQPIVTKGNDRVMNVPANDRTPVGTIRTDPTGVPWIREDTATPWGVEREYLNTAYLTAAEITAIQAGA